MRQSRKTIEEAIHFIFRECVRFANMPIDELKQIDKRDFFCKLPHPFRDGDMLCGHVAEVKLRVIAEEALYLNKLAGRVTLDAMRDLLGPELVKRFLTEKREINCQQIDRLMSWLGRAAIRKCSSQTHFIPCHLMYVTEPAQISIGPVTFHSRKSFRNRIVPSVRAYDMGEGRPWARRLLGGALRYYRGFKWFAEVTAPASDSEMSNQIAWEAITAAPNCLHLSFGANATCKMVVGGPRLERDNRGHLQIGPDGKLVVRLTLGGPGQIGFAPGWSSDLAGSEAEYFLKFCGVALEAAVDPGLQRPISRRVLDAIYWFGEGVRETSDAARIVKYVTVIERMLMTEEHDDISKVVSERCAAFCSISKEPLGLARWKEDVLTLYNLRSRLVHGDMSPLSGEVRDGVHLGEKISRFAILSVLRHFGEDGLRAESVPTKRLARWFDAIVMASQQLDVERSAVHAGGIGSGNRI
jgi:hypothetical protein